MKNLKLMLEYQCFPIWFYDEDGTLIDNDLPKPLQEDKELDNLLTSIQEKYDESFVDTPTGFFATTPTPCEQEELVSLIRQAMSLLERRYGECYIITCDYGSEE